MEQLLGLYQSRAILMSWQRICLAVNCSDVPIQVVEAARLDKLFCIDRVAEQRRHEIQDVIAPERMSVLGIEEPNEIWERFEDCKLLTKKHERQ